MSRWLFTRKRKVDGILRGIRGKSFFLCLIFSLSSLLFLSLLKDVSAEKKGWEEEKGKELPVTVTSDRMVSSQKENKIFFYGNVVAVRGDLTIRSDEMIIYNNPKAGKTEKITARGNVEIESKDRRATGEQAEYYDITQRIILTGNPRAWEQNNEITGDKMIFLIEEDKFIVDGGEEKGRQIKLTFFPKAKDIKKK